VQNLQVVSTDPAEGLILVRGAIPGAEGGWVRISDAVKQDLPKEAPFPAGLFAGAAAASAATAEEAVAPAEDNASAAEESTEDKKD